MYYGEFSEWRRTKHLSSMILIIIMMMAMSCQPTDHQHRDNDKSTPGASELKAELKQAMMVDPQQLVVREASVVNMPKGGGFYDVVLAVDAHDSTQMIAVSVCKANQQPSACQDSEHLAATIKFGSEALLTDAHDQTLFKLKACVAQDYSLSAESRCGPEHTIIHTLPSGAQDAALLGYEIELNRLRQDFIAWDDKVKQTMSGFQNYIDQCQGGNERAKIAAETRMWILLGALMATFPLQPSAMSTPSSTSSEVDVAANDETKPIWEQFVSDFKQTIDVMDTSAITQATECAQSYNEQGKGGLSAMCSLAAAWAFKQKWDQLVQYKNIVNNIGNIALRLNKLRLDLQNFNLDFDLAGIANTMMPSTMGSPTQFVFNTTNAFMDLAATDVILPCGERQRQHNQMDLVFSQFINTSRATQCSLYTQIKNRRQALGLTPLPVDICVEIRTELKTELAKLQPPPSEGLDPPNVGEDP